MALRDDLPCSIVVWLIAGNTYYIEFTIQQMLGEERFGRDWVMLIHHN